MISAPDTFATKGDATRFLALVEADMARDQYLDPCAGRMTLATWVDIWLGRPGKRAASVARDRQGLAAFLPHLGAIPLAAITPSQVQGAVDTRSRLAAPATVARDFSALRAVLNAAVDADLIARSPARKTALPRVRPPRREELTPEQLARLVAELPAIYRAVVMVGFVLGLRWGEAVALRVRDVDFMRRTVTVAQEVEELAGHVRIIPEVKTEAGLRTLSVPPFLMDAIALHLAEHRGGAGIDRDALVFLGPRGGILRRRVGERVLAPVVKLAGLPASTTFHGLRHTAVTAMADSGVTFNTTQGRAGHATARMTMEVYSHRTTAADRAAADAIQAHFGPSFSGQSGPGVAQGALGDSRRRCIRPGQRPDALEGQQPSHG